MIEKPYDVSRDSFIAAMRGVACSVTIVTTEGEAGRHGATVSAFSSLSADPPSVLICLKTQSRIAEAVRRNGIYSVNIMPEHAGALASRFAGCNDHAIADRFDGVEWFGIDGGGPRFPDATYLNCTVLGCHVHASHTIFIGSVTVLSIAQSPPLTYMDGSFHSIRRKAQLVGNTTQTNCRS